MILANISFIVISRDEAFAHQKCLESIHNLPLRNCQVICVDSGSKDKTLEVMSQYACSIDNLSIFYIRGESNAAVARNIGIRHASKDHIFFLDGDVEVNEDFIKIGLEYLQAKECDAITGRLEEIQYTQGYRDVINTITDRYAVRKVGKRYFSGGNFFCNRETVKQVGLFDETLTKSQDIDYTLRLTSSLTMFEIPHSMGTHHTVPYENTERIFESIKSQHGIYLGRCYFKNLRNVKGVFYLLKKFSGNSAGVFFYATLLLSLFVSDMLTIVLLFFPVTDVMCGFCKKKNIIYRVISHYLNPLFIIKGFIIFNKTSPVYSVVKITSNENIVDPANRTVC